MEVGRQRFADPHFHYWDLPPQTNAGAHNPTWLGTPGKTFPTYVEEHYVRDIEAAAPQALRFAGAVFVEALSDEPAKEAAWVQSLADQQAPGHQWLKAMVAYAYLPDHDIDAQLATLARFPLVKGIRQIINHHPENPGLTWPKVHSGDYLTTDEKFRHGYSLLQKYGLSFDLQVNPHQLKDAAAFVAQFPEIPVCLNHLGCLPLKEGTPEQHDALIATWREGMQALARLPHVYVKLSQLWFSKDGWEKKGSAEELLLKSLVKETLDLFTSERCMYASNFPVDKLSLTTADMYHRYLAWNEEWGLDAKARDDLLYATAAKFYRFNNTD